MIHLEKDQQLKDDPKVRVAVPTGDYNETDLIECYVEGGDPENPSMMYQAQYIGLGNFVYQQSDEWTEDQINALKANVSVEQVLNNRKLIDGKNPAAKFEGSIISKRGIVGKRRLKDGTVVKSTDKELVDIQKQSKKTEVVKDPEPTPEVSQPTASPTPSPEPSLAPSPEPTPVTEIQNNATSTSSDVSTTTPSNVSTTTESVIGGNSGAPDLDFETGSSTPEIGLENSTTTVSVENNPGDIDLVNSMPTSTAPILNPDANTNQGGGTSTDPIISMTKKGIKKLLSI